MPALQGELSYFRYLKEGSTASPQIEEAAQRAFAGKQARKQLIRAVYRGYLKAAIRPADRVIVKDPTAPLITAWLAEKFGALPVVIIRHPCGFASSIGKLDWEVSLKHFLRQPRLMNEHLAPYADVMQKAGSDIWTTRGAVWAAIHRVLLNQIETHPNWIICRYEDLCGNPEKEFGLLADSLGLHLGRADKKRIIGKSSRNNSDPGSTFKVSADMPNVWQKRLSPGQIDAIVGVTREFGFSDYDKIL
ncbi:hypothetical protein NOR53_2918 [gamma proteobacterium NOR5-3]|nr:hypothetical protein NOR53_2918 [gamma proteobacterium NOR5-3]